MQIYLNGKRTDASNATISAFDLGFTMGVTVTEQIRTFARQTPLLDRHLDRFFGGLKIIGLTLSIERAELESQIADLIELNGRLLSATDELGIGVCATPGIASAYGQTNAGPTILVYTYPLIADKMCEAFETGIRLTSVTTQEIAAQSLPKELKCRSRMHYYLAEQEAKAIDPNSRALLNSADGFIAEGTTASVVMVNNGQIVAPIQKTILSSVTLGYAIELAGDLDIPVHRRNIAAAELENADEVLWLTTPAGIIPVTHVNQNLIGNGVPGKTTKTLVNAWTDSLTKT
jgi:branched-subunit amino acid aminotransferase/4-amino-4-deoxychorismate lyase